MKLNWNKKTRTTLLAAVAAAFLTLPLAAQQDKPNDERAEKPGIRMGDLDENSYDGPLAEPGDGIVHPHDYGNLDGNIYDGPDAEPGPQKGEDMSSADEDSEDSDEKSD